MLSFQKNNPKELFSQLHANNLKVTCVNLWCFQTQPGELLLQRRSIRRCPLALKWIGWAHIEQQPALTNNPLKPWNHKRGNSTPSSTRGPSLPSKQKELGITTGWQGTHSTKKCCFLSSSAVPEGARSPWEAPHWSETFSARPQFMQAILHATN